MSDARKCIMDLGCVAMESSDWCTLFMVDSVGFACFVAMSLRASKISISIARA